MWTSFLRLVPWFCLHWFSIPWKVLFKTDFFVCWLVLNINKRFLAFLTFILGLNLENLKCKPKKKNDLSFVNITWNCELCILLKTRHFGWLYRNTCNLLKQCKHSNGKNINKFKKFRQSNQSFMQIHVILLV